MDYVFSKKGNKEILVTKGNSKELTGHRKVVRKLSNNQIIIDDFDIIEKIKTDDATKTNWYFIENHQQVVDNTPFDFAVCPSPLDDSTITNYTNTGDKKSLVAPEHNNTWLDNHALATLVKNLSGNYYNYAGSDLENYRLCLYRPDDNILLDSLFNCITYSDGTHPTREKFKYTFSDGKTIEERLVRISQSNDLLTFYKNGYMQLAAPGTISIYMYTKRDCNSMTINIPKDTILVNPGELTEKGQRLMMPYLHSPFYRSIKIGFSNSIDSTVGYLKTIKGSMYTNTRYVKADELFSTTIQQSKNATTSSSYENGNTSCVVMTLFLDPASAPEN